MNHLHLQDIHYGGCADISKDKLIALGNVLREIYQAKLQWQFPERPCAVEFWVPTDADDLTDYQLSFWQNRHEEHASQSCIP